MSDDPTALRRLETGPAPRRTTRCQSSAHCCEGTRGRPVRSSTKPRSAAVRPARRNSAKATLRHQRQPAGGVIGPLAFWSEL
jgi:hypothetical protein